MNGFARGTEGFDRTKSGALPEGWTAGVTGKGSPRWSVEADPTAPSAPNVLKQSGSGTFPWCVLNAASVVDGFVEVRFKPVAGREDQAGGVVWHTLHVEFTGSRIKVILDGTARIEVDDRHIEGAGAVGVWTKADSVTLFDDFAYGAKP